MILLGEEIQALLGAMTIYEHVPFVDTRQPVVSEEEREAIDVVSHELRTARSAITPQISRDTPGWLAQLHAAETSVILSHRELDLLAHVAGACLLELRTDGDLSAHVGGVHLSALRSAYDKIIDARSSS